ncbi:MAG: M15 family metallopeptidase [Acidimicrobiia bacterium]
MSISLGIALLSGPAIPEYPERGEPLGDRALSEDLSERSYRNGHIPADLLMEVESGTRKRCLLEEEAAEAWLALTVHAAHDGVDLQIASCYRSFTEQRSAYHYNCPIEATPLQRTAIVEGEDGPEETTVVEHVKKRVCRVPTAKPGNSNHSWGRAVDVMQRSRLLTCRSKTFRWLQDNAGLYGWVHPPWAGCGKKLEEPWHWEWAGTQSTVPRTMLLFIVD